MNRKLKLSELGRLSAEQFRESKKSNVSVVLDNIRSHFNVGSIFRTADAFLVNEILLCGYTPVPPHREIHKTALGATETVSWKHFSSTAEAITYLRKMEYRIIAVEQTETTIPLQSFEIFSDEKIAMVFGNEVGGIDQEIIDLCDDVIEIPQFGTKHSLNISVCAGIVLWELTAKTILRS